MAYNYRQTIYPVRPILPSRPVIQYPVKPTQPVRPLYRDFVYPKSESYLSDYNDPLEINSFVDILLTTFNPNMRRWDLGGLEKIPILNIVPSAVQHVYEGTVEPLIHGKPGQMGLNLLMNIGETMDVVANPLKALMQGRGWEGFVRGLGMGLEGHYNYDWDTGNIILDMVLEYATDPLNWITVGGEAVLKQAAKKAGLESVEALIKDAATGWILKSLDKVVKHTNTFEKVLWKGAMYSSGVEPTWLALKEGYTAVSQFKKNKINDILKPFQKFDNTLSFLDFDSFQAQWNKETYGLNKLLKILDETPVEANVATIIMRDSVALDLKFWMDTFQMYMDDPLRIRETIVNKLLKEKHGLNSIEEYIRALEMLNLKTNGAYAAFADTIKQNAQSLVAMENVQRIQLRHTNLVAQRDQINRTAKHMNAVFREYKDPAAPLARSLNVNLPYLIEREIKKELSGPGWSTESIAERIQKIVLIHREKVGLKLLEELERTVEITDSPILKQALEQYKKIANDFYKDLFKQAEVQKKFAGTIPFINYNKKHIVDQIFNRLKDLEDTILKAIKDLPEISATQTSTAFDELRTLHSLGEQYGSQIVDELMKNKAKNTQHKFVYSAQDVNAVNKIKSKITKIFGEDIQQWWDVYRQGMPLGKSTPVDEVQSFVSVLAEDIVSTYGISKMSPLYKEYYDTVFNSLIQMTEEQQQYFLDYIVTRMAKDPASIPGKQQFQQPIKFTRDTSITEAKVSPHRLEEVIHTFLTTEPTNIDDFAAAWQDLQKALVDLRYSNTNMWDTLDELIETLEELNPIRLEENLLTVTAEGASYQLQLEKLHTNITLMGDETAQQMITEITQNTGLGAVLQSIARSDSVAKDAAAELIERAQLYVNYLEFLKNTVYQIPDNRTRLALLSTFQNYHKMDPALFIANFEYYLDQIINRMQDFVNTKIMRESLSAEALANTLGIDITGLHTAGADVSILEKIVQERLPDLIKDPTKKYVFCDIETMFLNASAGPLIEIGVKPLGEAPKTFSVKLDPKNPMHIPQDRSLSKILPGKSREEQLIAFFQGHLDGFTEEEVLGQFLQYLGTLGDNTVLVFHNGEAFDINFILERMKQYQIDPIYFNRIQKLDTLAELKKNQNYFTVSEQNKEAIRQLLTQYSTSMQGHHKLIDPNSGALASLCLDLSKASQEAQVGKNLAENLTQLGITTYSHVNEAGEALYVLGNSIFSELKHIKDTNKLFHNSFIDKALVTGDEGVEAFIRSRMQLWGKTREEIIEMFGSYVNMSKYLYAGPEVINYIGYKTVVDFPAILEWFQFTPGAQIDAKTARAYTSLAKRLDKTHAAIKNPARLEPFNAEIQSALELLVPQNTQRIIKDITSKLNDAVVAKDIELIKYWQDVLTNLPIFNPKVSLFYSNLRIDKTDTLSNWVLLQYIFNQYKLKNVLSDDIINKVDPILLELLLDPAPVYHRVVTGSQFTYFEKMAALSIDTVQSDPRALKAEIVQYQQSMEALARRGATADELGLSRSIRQTLSACTADLGELLDVWATRMDVAKHSSQKIKLIDKAADYTNNLAMQQLYQILSLSPDDLFAFMAHGNFAISFNPAEYIHDNAFKNLIANLLENKQLLSENNIELFTTNSRTILYIKDIQNLNHIIDPDGMLHVSWKNGNKLIAPELKDLDLEAAARFLEDEELATALGTARQALHRLSDNQITGSLGELFDAEAYDRIFSALPDEVLKAMDPLNTELWKHTDFYQTLRFNQVNLGSTTTRQLYQPYTPSTVLSIYKNSTEFGARQTAKQIQSIQMYYKSGFSINTGWTKDIAPEQLIDAFKRTDEYVMSALIEDSKHGYKVIQIPLETVEDVARARAVNAVCMSHATHSKMIENINFRKFDNKALDLWSKLLYMYKVGYLTDPGVWTRNYLDSTLKNIISAEASAPEVIKAQVEAIRLFMQYNKCVDDIIKLSKTGRFENKHMRFYFEKMNPAMSLEVYNLIHGVTQDGPIGLASRWVKYYKDARVSAGELAGVWNTFTHYASKLLAPTSHIEQVERLAQYLLLMKKSNPPSTAKIYKIIADTHFDYNIKSDAERMTELIFPFYTFTMRNIEYWIDAVNKYPWIASLFRDIMTPIWDFDDHDAEEIASNQSLQHQMLSGNLPLNDQGLTLKTSPSFMDTFNAITDPVGTAVTKLASPLKVIGGLTLPDPISSFLQTADKGMYDQVADVVPILGTFYQRYLKMGPKYYERTSDLLNLSLPGVFGATNIFNKKISLPKKQYISNQYKRPYYTKKYYPKRYYAKKYYAKRYYAKRPPHTFAYRMSTYTPKTYSKINYYSENFYKKLYTTKGKSRLAQMAKPVTASTLKYRLKDLFYYYK